MAPITVDFKGYTISTDKTMMQPAAVHQWLSEKSYWCKHIPFDLVKQAMDNSYCIGAFKDDKQVAYGRFITDYAVFAHLADVYVEEEHRGLGIGKKMMEILTEQDWVKKLRSMTLGTLDAQGLYKQFGFSEIAFPERRMEIIRPDVYGDPQNQCR